LNGLRTAGWRTLLGRRRTARRGPTATARSG
jgi:hypothetical protein